MAFGRKNKQNDHAEQQVRELELQLDELEDRIRELEQQLAGQGELRAREITLVDGQGEPRIQLAAGEREGPQVRMLDSQGRVRLRLRVVGDMPVFELEDARGNPKTWFGVGADGNPTIQLRDGTGRDRLAVLVSRRQGAKITLVDSGGKASSVMAEGVFMADEGIVKKLFLKAEAEQERAARPFLSVIQGGLGELEEEEQEEDGESPR